MSQRSCSSPDQACSRRRKRPEAHALPASSVMTGGIWLRRSVTALVVLVAGCKSEQSKLADLLDNSASWSATVAAHAQPPPADRVPCAYVEDTFREADTELDSAAATLGTMKAAIHIRDQGQSAIG